METPPGPILDSAMALTNQEILEKARQLPIPIPWNRDQFIANMAELRGRPIRLVPTDTISLVDSPCGLWLARAEDDVILYEADTSVYHVDQIIRHEVGHMVLGHARTRVDEGAADELDPSESNIARILEILPDIDPATIRSVLGRQDFANDQEREAETFASLMALAIQEREESASMMRTVFFPDEDR